MLHTALDLLKSMPVRNNFHDDCYIFQSVDQIVLSGEHSISTKAEAIRWLSDKVMGQGRETNKSDRLIVVEYVEELVTETINLS